MLKIDSSLKATDLWPAVERLFSLSADKIRSIERSWKPADGTPVFTVKGEYTSRGWTDWTQGFQFGSAILQFDATDNEEFLAIGRRKTVECMASHVSHTGVHDHGFNNVLVFRQMTGVDQHLCDRYRRFRYRGLAGCHRFYLSSAIYRISRIIRLRAGPEC